MIIRSMYFGRREVSKIYRAGKIIWPATTELPLSVITDIFSNGYHAMLTGETIIFTSREAAVSVPVIDASVLQTVRPGVDSRSETVLDGSVLPVPAIVCVCDAASMTHGEINTLVAGAVSFRDHTDMLTNITAHSLVAEAITGDHEQRMETNPEASVLVAGTAYGDHEEDSVTDPKVSGIVSDAVYGEHGADIATTPDVTAEVSTVVFGAFTEDNGNDDDASMNTAGAVFASSQSDNKTDSSITMIPFHMSGVVELDTDAESHTEETTGIGISDPVSMASMLRLVTTCEVHMLAAPVAGMFSHADSKTTAAIFLHFEGSGPDVPVEKWYDPVQTGNDLYIRSAWLFWYDGDKGHIDTAVWYEVIRKGNNLYIRSVDSSYQDREQAFIDLPLWLSPIQEGENLRIRSAASVWTDGGSANIDTAFFLEPVQEGNNLYIRQNIFGGE